MNNSQRWKWSALPEALIEAEQSETIADIESHQSCTWDDAVAWVATRSLEQVAISHTRFKQLSNEGPYGAAFLTNILACLDIDPSAEKNLMRSLNAQKVRATGINGTSGERGAISADDWRNAYVVYDKSANLANSIAQRPAWFDIWVNWKDLRAEFPSLNASPNSSQDPLSPALVEQWTRRALKPEQITAMEFIHNCGARWRDGEEGTAKELHGRYQLWVTQNKRGTALERTAFNKWCVRYQQGYRVGGRKIVHPS